MIRILVVEDNFVISLDIRKQLKSLGYAVIPFSISSGEEAIEKTEETRPDLVLMDIGLQGKMDGIQAAEIIQRQFKIPIVYLTAHVDEKTQYRAVQTASPYLLKPFSGVELQEAISMVLNQKVR